jgi:hypothetical protein
MPGLLVGRIFDRGYLRIPVGIASAGLITSTFLIAECTEYWHFLLCQGFFVGVRSLDLHAKKGNNTRLNLNDSFLAIEWRNYHIRLEHPSALVHNKKRFCFIFDDYWCKLWWRGVSHCSAKTHSSYRVGTLGHNIPYVKSVLIPAGRLAV